MKALIFAVLLAQATAEETSSDQSLADVDDRAVDSSDSPFFQKGLDSASGVDDDTSVVYKEVEMYPDKDSSSAPISSSWAGDVDAAELAGHETPKADKHKSAEHGDHATTEVGYHGATEADGPEAEEANGQETMHLSGHHAHGYVAICFMFVSMVLGGLISVLLERCKSPLPYTVSCFLCGILLSLIDGFTNKGLGSLSESMKLWVQIDPHLLLFAFLPGLIFADGCKLNIHLTKRVFSQCFLLAGPGVLLGAILGALIATHVLPYGWDWRLCMAFGGILSATDPVAVVALLKSLGASSKLTMIVTGESLMNDGAAIVVFILFWDMYCGKEYTLEGGLLYFARLAIGGPIVGIIFGALTIWILSAVSSKASKTNCIVQISLTLASAYLSFFFAEHSAGVSGVLAVCGTALVCSAFMPQRLISQETMDHVWEMVRR
jgi:hypothetical protein